MGNMFRFVHCADLHLGSRFKGLGSVDRGLAERMRLSVMESFERIVDAAIRERVDMMVISGDLYDDSNELPSTRMWLVRQLSRLTVPVFICRGNHDSRTSWDGSIPYPSNVHEFGPEVESIMLEGGIQVLGASYSTPHESRNLASMMQGDPGAFTVACLHCDIDTYSEGYPYAPCSINDMIGRGVDYWALGHIHKRNVILTGPYVVYPGNIQGRSFKETGEKGAYLVTVESGRVSSLTFIPTQTYIWEDITVDITGRSLPEIVGGLSHLGGDRVCRLRFVGSGELDTMLRTSSDEVRKAVSDSTGCIVSDVIVETVPSVDLDARSEGRDMGAAIIQCGRRMEAMGKDEIVDLVCQNKVMARYRQQLMSMTDEEVRSLVSDAMRSSLAKMEALR